MKHQAAARAELPPEGANKWEVLRELAAGRSVFDLSDRDISVLQALISFYPATILGGNGPDLIIHPSNKAICERLNGMACSTMRRHLGHLVQSGFIVRRDSPNGKRYARRYGEEKLVFGFDLSPLVLRSAEICEAAETVRASEERQKRLRTAVSLMRRDVLGFVEFGRSLRPDLGLWDQLSDLAVLTARDLRRKLGWEELKSIESKLIQALDSARKVVEPSDTTDMSTNDANYEHHYQNSNKDSNDLEPCFEQAKGQGARVDPEDATVDVNDDDNNLPNVPLGLVLATCQEFKNYTEGSVRYWHELVRAADIVRPMMGISPSAWENAKLAMGPEEAAVVVVAMLERFDQIQSPGGYLRALTAKAEVGAFSCGPMIMAQMRRDAA